MFTRTRKFIGSLAVAGLVLGGAAAVSTVEATPAQAATRNCYGTYFNVGSQQDIACMGAGNRASWTPYNGNAIVSFVSGFCQNKWKYGYFSALTTARQQLGESRGQAVAYGGTLRGSICP